jgi:hypothetical protein
MHLFIEQRRECLTFRFRGIDTPLIIMRWIPKANVVISNHYPNKSKKEVIQYDS